MKLNHLKSEKGSVMVIVALMFTVLMGFGALTIDIGRVTIEKSKLQNATDAAVLAGAQELDGTVAGTSKAEAAANKYITLNGYSEENIYVSFTDYNTIDITTKPEELAKHAGKVPIQVNYTFAKLLGFDNTQVNVTASAAKGGLSSGISGLKPWALGDKYEVVGGTKKNPTYDWVNFNYTYGLQFTLKDGGGDGVNGHYRIVSFAEQGTDASTYKGNITDGYDGIVKINDTLNDATGNKNVKNVIEALMTKSGDTVGDYTKAQQGNSRIVIVPKIESQTLKVIGFAVIYLKSVNNKGEITANFLYDTTWSEENKATHYDWGLNSKIKLTK